MTYDRYGDQYRWQFFQLLSFAGGPTQRETARDRFTLFPLYFQQRSSDPSENYTAVFPLYGHLKHRLFRDEIFFVMFPLYSETRKKDVVTDNYLWPVFSLRHGDGLARLEVVAAGRERAQRCHHSNQRFQRRDNHWRARQLFHALAVVLQHQERDRHHERAVAAGVHPRLQRAALAAARLDHRYLALLQPRGRPGEEIPRVGRALAAGRVRPRRRQDTRRAFGRSTATRTTRRWRAISGSGRYTNTTACIRRRWTAGARAFASSFTPTWRRRTPRPRRCGGGLSSGRSSPTAATSTETADCKSWPCSNPSFQETRTLSAIIRRSGRSGGPRQNPRAGASSQSLLWNLYRHDTTPDTKKCSLLFGLFQYQSSPEGKQMRLFYIPLNRAKAPAHDGAKAGPAKPA